VKEEEGGEEGVEVKLLEGEERGGGVEIGADGKIEEEGEAGEVFWNLIREISKEMSVPLTAQIFVWIRTSFLRRGLRDGGLLTCAAAVAGGGCEGDEKEFHESDFCKCKIFL
jgi:hypothetical protein